jgi:hypothetical protein
MGCTPSVIINSIAIAIHASRGGTGDLDLNKDLSIDLLNISEHSYTER